MIFFPAIDLKEGKCVRLVQGDMEKSTIFNRDPVAQALQFENQGFKYLHVVDLEGACEGEAKNESSIKAILSHIKIPLQIGGGIRNIKTIEKWLEWGANRVILGTVAVQNPLLVKQAATRYPGKIVIGVDAREGLVAVEGWTKTSLLTVEHLCRRFIDIGIAAIIYTDISRDGLLQGINIESTLSLAHALPIPVIASGGVGSIGDIERLLQADCSILEGAIIGRALYEGRVKIEQIKRIKTKI